jgi:hypothetical protein
MKIHLRLFTLLGMLAGCVASGPAGGVKYYVDASKGSDSNAGTTTEIAWKTIQHAADNMKAGDIGTVLPGNYDERVQVTRSGTAQAPIIFQARSSEGRAVVTHGFTIRADHVHVIGFEITDTVNEVDDGAGIFVVGSDCVISGNHIHDVTRPGIFLDAKDPDSPLTSHCIVRENIIERAGLTGIWISGRQHLVESNNISHTLQHPRKWVNPPGWADADGLRFFGSGHTIRKNHVHDIRLSDEGNHSPHIDALQTYGPAYDILIEQNLFDVPDDHMQGAMISSVNPPVRDLTFRNNIFKVFRGLNIWGEKDVPLHNVHILNNTFVGNLAFTGESMYAIELHHVRGGLVANNIFFNNGNHRYPYLGEDHAEGTSSFNNCHFMNDGAPPKGIARSGDLWQMDPQFTNAAINDFRLAAGSRLIDAGRTLPQVSNDYSGVTRPQGKGYDIGAFEYAGHP